MAKMSLLIRSVLGNQPDDGDTAPLLLAAVQGVEGLSLPYSFDLTLYRRPEHGDIDPRQLVNTRAAFGIRYADDKYLYRAGVIETFEKSGDNNVPHSGSKTMLVYRAHLVPAIKMLDHERVFRVFEEKSVIDILREVLAGASNIDPNTYLVKEYADDDNVALIDYCVQFNETTFAFISRLLNQSGIGYRFDQTYADQTSNYHERMILNGTTPHVNACLDTDMTVRTWRPTPKIISTFRRLYQVAHKTIVTGDFNTLVPWSPWRGSSTTDAEHDLLPKLNPTTGRFNTEGFPTTPPQKNPKGDQDNVDGDATSADQDEEAGVFSVAGQTKNRTFMAGQTFHIAKDDTEDGRFVNKWTDQNAFGDPNGQVYLVTLLAIAAAEMSYGNNFGNDILTFINPARWWDRETEGKDGPGIGIDVSSAVASGVLQNWTQDEGKAWLDSPDNKPINILASMGSSILGLSGNLLGILFNNVKEWVGHHKDDYSNIFSAMPWELSRLARMPLPQFTPAIANGPHLAVVIAEQGTDKSKGDVYCDALGRVRVRFPWHRALSDATETGAETNPWKTGRDTAWVRVSDGWASQGFGTQFLPRIGDEVIVSFLDGDPGRPIITGRVYNASSGPSGLPFPAKGAKHVKIPDDYVHTPQSTDGGAPGPNYTTLRSGIRTRSTPASGASAGFHMMRFDDTAGSEQLLLRSQARMDITALGTRYETIGGDRNLTVGWIDTKHQVVGGNYISKVFQDYTLHVGDPAGPFNGGHRYERVEQEYELNVVKDMLVSLEQNLSAEVAEVASISAGSIVLQATNKITLKVGNSWIVITPAGVFASGPIVGDNSGGSPDTATTVTLTQPIATPTNADPGTT